MFEVKMECVRGKVRYNVLKDLADKTQDQTLTGLRSMAQDRVLGKVAIGCWARVQDEVRNLPCLK